MKVKKLSEQDKTVLVILFWIVVALSWFVTGVWYIWGADSTLDALLAVLDVLIAQHFFRLALDKAIKLGKQKERLEAEMRTRDWTPE